MDFQVMEGCWYRARVLSTNEFADGLRVEAFLIDKGKRLSHVSVKKDVRRIRAPYEREVPGLSYEFVLFGEQQVSISDLAFGV